MRIEKNHVKHNPEITQAILDDMATAVGSTYSPVGASTLMIQSIPGPDGSSTANVRGSVSKDGSSALSSVVYDNPTCMAIKRLVMSTMAGVLQTAADGTTTTTLLLAELYRNIRNTEFYKKGKIPAQLLQDLISEVVEDIVKVINTCTKDNPTTLEDVLGIVRTTVNSDKEVFNAISSAILEMLDKGCDLKNLAFRFEADLTSAKSSYSVDTGYAIPDSILASNFFGGFTSNECVVVMIDRSVQTGDQIKAILDTMKGIADLQYNNACMQVPFKPVLFITEDIKYKNLFTTEYHKYMAGYKESHNFMPATYILEYRADGSVLSRDEHDDFIQLLGQPINYDLFENYQALFGIELKEGEQSMKMSDFIIERYCADKLAQATVTMGKTSTIVKDVVTVENNVLLSTRVEYLKDAMTREVDEIKKNEFRGRLYKLEGYYAIVKIASDNEWDVRRKLDAVEDAVGAIKAAVMSSAVGGMSTLVPKMIYNLCQEYDISTPEGKMKDELVEAIFKSYKKLYDIIMTNSGMEENKYFKAVITHNDEEDTSEFLKRGVDIYKVLSSFRTGKNSFEDVKTHSVLNSSSAEIRILEATTKAVSTLLGINQICLPDKYDAQAYENNN